MVAPEGGLFASAANGHKQLPAAFFGLHFGKNDEQVADGVAIDFLFGHAQPPVGQRQAADAVALSA